MRHEMKKRSAFTMTELLVVITIIGMLAALVTVAARAAMGAARRGVIKLEMTQLDMALEQYKNKYGEYPPDGTDAAAVTRHLRKCFPNMTSNPGVDDKGYVTLPYVCLCDGSISGHDASHKHVELIAVTPVTAMTIFLGGNLAKNPMNPLAEEGDRVDAFFEFKPEQLGTEETGTDGMYFPLGLERDKVAPFVYFKARLLDDTGAYATVVDGKQTPLSYLTGAGTAAPFADGEPNPANLNGTGTGQLTKWRNAMKYQIVTSGLDGLFGSQVLYGSRTSSYGSPENVDGAFMWDEAVYDNLTNFAEGTLGDELEE